MLRRAISGSYNRCDFIPLISYQAFSAGAELLYIPTIKVWAVSPSPSTAALGEVCPLPGYSSHLHVPHGWRLFHVLIRHLQVPFDEMLLLAACRHSNWIVCVSLSRFESSWSVEILTPREWLPNILPCSFTSCLICTAGSLFSQGRSLYFDRAQLITFSFYGLCFWCEV